jgi:hypothetical protein
MEQQSEIILQKARSYRAILSAGTRLYITAFRRFFKASWLTALIYALVNAALGTLTAMKVPELIVVIQLQLLRFQGVFIETLQSYLPSLVLFFVLLCGTVGTMALAQATIFSLLKTHSENGEIPVPASWWKPQTDLMGRTLKGVVLTLLVSIPLLIIAPLLLPLWYVQTKYILEPASGFWHTLRKGYVKAMGHWGLLFLVFFLTTLFILLTGLVVMLPAHILFLANYRAQMGVLIGDPLGMPSYMTALTFCTFVLCSMLYFYVCLPLLLNGYYIYGSIEAETKEHEKQQLDLI